MSEPDLVRSIVAPGSAVTDPVKGSRFRGDVAPVTDEPGAMAFIETIRTQHADASHHCWAFALADGLQRCSDDGEPRDTAGAPILRHLGGAGLADIVVVVTRWYGGTNLGRGGLIRAYGDAAAASLHAVEVVERQVLTQLTLVHGYDLTATVEAVLAAYDATETGSTYGVRVERTVTVPRAMAEAFADALTDATAGRVRPT